MWSWLDHPCPRLPHQEDVLCGRDIIVRIRTRYGMQYGYYCK